MKKSLLLACVLGLGGGSVAFAHGFHGPFSRIDADGDGKVTLAEAQKAATEQFARVDANKDSRVTKQELAAFGEQVRNDHEGDRGAWIEKRFANKDANKDGRLSRDEVAHMPDEFFARVDANKDGYLTKEEMAAGASAMHDHMKGGFAQHVAAEFTAADTNKDGAVDSKELSAAVAQRFTKLDENKDGAVERDEMHHGRGGDCEGKGWHHGDHTHGAPNQTPAGSAGNGSL